MPLTKAQKQAQQIVDAALELADQSDWESVRLHQVSDRLGISLDEVRQHYREKEELIDAWFDRADQAMLQVTRTPGFAELPRTERLHRTLMAWLGALYGHRRATRQMVLGKLEPGHLHYQIGGLLRISRTVQWWREAAGISSRLPHRAFEEAAMTGLYLATFLHWMLDRSEHNQATGDFLQRRLELAEQLSDLCGCSPRPSTETA